MDKEQITLSKREQQRLKVLNRILAGDIDVEVASEQLRLSIRQVYRLLAAYRQQGAAALVHGNRGRRPAVALPPELREQALEIAARPEYDGANDTHLAELLADLEGLHVSRSTLRRWLREAGRPSPRKRRSPRYRRWRDRAPRRGLLLQVDTCFHPWFEDRGPACALVASIDDATGEVVSAHFRPQEDTEGYFLMLQDILRRRGLPGAFYHDGRSTFIFIRQHIPLEDQLEGVVPQTQFARACDHLGIALIHARSPQAKGRIERLWLTFQDRLRIELRLAGVSCIDQANAFLPTFLPAFNRKFAVPPAEPQSAFLPLPPNLDVAAICCPHYRRSVNADNTVSIDGLRLQLPPAPGNRSRRRLRITVQRRLDGSWAIYDGDTCLVHPAPVAVAPLPASRPLPDTPSAPRQPAKPKPNHPWRRIIAAEIAQLRAAPSQPSQ